MPIELLGQRDDAGYRRRRYTRAQHIERLAIEKYNKNGNGITFNDLVSAGFTSHKEDAQITLKYCHKKNVLFTISNHKPQKYYPTCLKSDISKAKMIKNIPVRVTGIGCSKASLFSRNNSNTENSYIESNIAVQSLEGYILPLLPSVPLFIHKMHFKLKITPECYKELKLPVGKGNNGKEHVEVIGKVRVSYRFYANGTVIVFTESSNNPFKLEDEIDRSRLLVFFGQIKEGLVGFLMDKHERLVPDILEWELTQCDINKDVSVEEYLQYTGIKVQVKHFDHLLRVYIKSMGKDTVCRVEESLNPKEKSAIEAISTIFNPFDEIKDEMSEIRNKVDRIYCRLISNNDSNQSGSCNDISDERRSLKI
jgi:hypothetical protein